MSLQNFRKAFKRPDRKKEKELNQSINEFGLEKKDLPAMVISAYIVIIPAALLALGLLALVAYLFVR